MPSGKDIFLGLVLMAFYWIRPDREVDFPASFPYAIPSDKAWPHKDQDLREFQD